MATTVSVNDGSNDLPDDSDDAQITPDEGSASTYDSEEYTIGEPDTGIPAYKSDPNKPHIGEAGESKAVRDAKKAATAAAEKAAKKIRDSMKADEQELRSRLSKEVSQSYSESQRQLQRDISDRRQELRNQLSAIRAAATSRRVQMLAFAPFFGRHGYTLAAAADAYLYQPQTEKQVQTIQEQLRAAEEDYRARQDALRAERDANLLRAQGQTPSGLGYPGSTGSGNFPPGGAPLGGLGNVPPGVTGGGQSPGIPPNVPPGQPPGMPPGQPLTPQGPLLPPVTATGLIPLAAIAEILGSAKRHAEEIGKHFVDHDPVGAMKPVTSATGGLLGGLAGLAVSGGNPLAASFGASIGSMAGDSMGSILLSIDQNVKKITDVAVATMPQSLQSTVQGELRIMMNQFRIGREVDPIVSAIINAKTDFSIAMDNLMGRLTILLGPVMIKGIEFGTAFVDTNTLLVDSIAALRDTAFDPNWQENLGLKMGEAFARYQHRGELPDSILDAVERFTTPQPLGMELTHARSRQLARRAAERAGKAFR